MLCSLKTYMEVFMLGMLGRTKRQQRIPPTVLLLTVETDIHLAPAGEPDTYKLLTIPRTKPKIILKNSEGKKREANYGDWWIGNIAYDFERNLWYISLSMSTSVFSNDNTCVAVGFNGDECHVASYYGFAGDERIRYSRIGYGFFEDEPYAFYPEIRTRIRDRKRTEARR